MEEKPKPKYVLSVRHNNKSMELPVQLGGIHYEITEQAARQWASEKLKELGEPTGLLRVSEGARDLRDIGHVQAAK